MRTLSAPVPGRRGLCGESMRALTESERHAILVLAEELGSSSERDQLLSDIATCLVRDRASDKSLLELILPGYKRRAGQKQHAYRGKDGFPVEGSMRDADGAEISV